MKKKERKKDRWEGNLAILLSIRMLKDEAKAFNKP